MSKPIVVTGATGTIGRQVAEALLSRGASVRIAVRDPERMADLRARGAEVVPFDWDRPEQYGPAFAGASAALLITPFVEHFVPWIDAALAAARAGGVGHVVRVSAFGASPDAPVGAEHGVAEVHIKAGGIPWTILQPSFFADNVLTYQGPSVKGDGAFYGASAGGRSHYVSSRDIAAVAATVLVAPAAWAGETLVLTGPTALTDAELAAAAGDVLGRDVRYVDVPAEAYGQSLVSQGTPAWMADHLVFFEGVKAQGWASHPTGDVERVLGRPAEDVRNALRRYV